MNDLPVVFLHSAQILLSTWDSDYYRPDGRVVCFVPLNILSTQLSTLVVGDRLIWLHIFSKILY